MIETKEEHYESSSSSVRKEDFRRIEYSQRGIWSDLIVLTTCFFPFQIYPILASAALLYLTCIREIISLQYIFYLCCMATVVSLSVPLFYFRNFDTYNILANHMISWHKSVTVAVPLEEFPRTKSGYVFAVHPHGRVFVSFSIILFFYRRWLMSPSHEHDIKEEEKETDVNTDGLQIQKSQVSSQEPCTDKSLLNHNTNMFFGVTSTLLAVPIVRNVLGLLGLVSATKSILKEILMQGDHIALLVGGVQEVCLGTYNHKDILYLNKRKGFLKLAMETGSGVVPVYCFGENRLFKHTYKIILDFWKVVNRYIKIGAPFPVCGPFNLMIPYRGELLLLFGKPLFPQKDESLDQFHARYVSQLEALFQAFVKETSNPNLVLEIL